MVLKNKFGIKKYKLYICVLSNKLNLYQMKEQNECNGKMFPKGFWSKNGKPTQNALMMYFVYLTHLPESWKKKVVHKPSLEKTRQYFDVDYGIECMLTWGIQFGCKNSKTSDERHHAMSLAYHDALGMIGQGYRYTELKIK